MTSKDVQVIEKKLSPIMAAVEKLEVVDEASENEATIMLSQLNVVGDAMKEKKAKVYDPAWETVVAIREEWKPKETILKNAIDLIRSKMSKYRTAAKAKADAEEQKITDRIGEGSGKYKIETAARKAGEIERPVETVTTGAGVVKYKTVLKFEVMDVTMLPAEYILPDEVAIRKAMLGGQKLPGVRYFEEQVPTNYR